MASRSLHSTVYLTSGKSRPMPKVIVAITTLSNSFGSQKLCMMDSFMLASVHLQYMSTIPGQDFWADHKILFVWSGEKHFSPLRVKKKCVWTNVHCTPPGMVQSPLLSLHLCLVGTCLQIPVIILKYTVCLAVAVRGETKGIIDGCLWGCRLSNMIGRRA